MDTRPRQVMADGSETPEPEWLARALRGTPPYRGPQTAHDWPDGLAAAPSVRFLHLNESPYPPSPRAIAALQDIGPINRYPDIHARPLARALEARTGISADRIIFGAGSDELIHFLCEVALDPGDDVVVPAPSFPRYAMSGRLRGARVIHTGLTAGGAVDGRAIADATTKDTKLVFACTPNNPSGGMMTAEALQELAERIPPGRLLVIDEAYHEFARHESGPDVLAIMKRHRPGGAWIVLRTFSKAYGLAALRVGYGLCGSALVADALRKSKLQFNVTTPGQRAALAALDDDAHLARTLDAIADERTRLAEAVRGLGLLPLPSSANFLSMRLPFTAGIAMDALATEGILVRDWRDPDYMAELRVTIGFAADTDAVVAALGRLLRARAATA